jgi:hypothetical protein
MMWEAAKGSESIWEGYLGMRVDILYELFRSYGYEIDTMPVRFDTPMFWPIADLEELRGTSIAGMVSSLSEG